MRGPKEKRLRVAAPRSFLPGAGSRAYECAAARRRARATLLVAAPIHQRALLDPRHHAPQLGADLLDRMLRHLLAHRLERGLVDLVLEHPVAREAARLDVG